MGAMFMPDTLAYPLEILIFLLLFWLLSFFSALLHELGHAAGYKIATGDSHWQIRIGSGKRLIHTRKFTVKLFVIDGFFCPLDDKMDTPAKRITMLVGGPLASLILLAALLAFWFSGIEIQTSIISVEPVVSLAVYINTFILASSLIPMHYLLGEIKGMETDGLQILNNIKKLKK